MTCTARIRPMRPVDDVELRCEHDGPHVTHRSTLRDYARPGSATVFEWSNGDRRCFDGSFGACEAPGCILPAGHGGAHAR